MQGNWAIAFRGPEDKITAMKTAVTAYCKEKNYKELLDALEHFSQIFSQEDGKNVLLFESTASCQIIGMEKFLVELAPLDPSLEGVCATKVLNADNQRVIYYSAPGDDGSALVKLNAHSYTSGGIRIHVSRDAWECYHSWEEELREDGTPWVPPDISWEDAKALEDLYIGDSYPRDHKPFTFTFAESDYDEEGHPVRLGEPVTYRSDEGRFHMDYDGDFENEEDLVWSAGGTGRWNIVDEQHNLYSSLNLAEMLRLPDLSQS